MRMSVLVLVAAIVAGCGGSGSTGAVAGSPSQSVVEPSTAASASVKPSPTATGPKAPATHVPTPSSSGTQASTCVTHTLGDLTEAQRIGQLFMIGLAKDTLGTAERSAIATYHFGSVSFTTKTSIGVARVRAITDAVQDQATSAATGGVRVLRRRQPGRRACPGAVRARLRHDPVRAEPGLAVDVDAQDAGRAVGRSAACGGRQPRPGARGGRRAARDRRDERPDRQAQARVRPHAVDRGQPRRSLHRRHEDGRDRDHRQALPRAGPGRGQHRLHGRGDATRSRPSTIPTSSPSRGRSRPACPS